MAGTEQLKPMMNGAIFGVIIPVRCSSESIDTARRIIGKKDRMLLMPGKIASLKALSVNSINVICGLLKSGQMWYNTNTSI